MDPIPCNAVKTPRETRSRRNGDHGHQISKDTGLRQIQIGKCIVQEEKMLLLKKMPPDKKYSPRRPAPTAAAGAGPMRHQIVSLKTGKKQAAQPKHHIGRSNDVKLSAVSLIRRLYPTLDTTAQNRNATPPASLLPLC